MKSKPINRTLFATVCLLIIFLGSISSYAQKDMIELTFTAINSSNHIQLDSIKVINRTQGGDTILYWPDTVLSLYYLGINDINNSADEFQVFQNYPNPVADYTNLSLFVPEKDQVSILVTDLLGRVILECDRILDKGIHSFRFTPGGENLYFITTQWRGKSSCTKILRTTSNLNGMVALEYTGSEISSLPLKVSHDIQSFSFNSGDELLYIGYSNTLQSGQLDEPESTKTYTFQFATNIPCSGTPTVEYEGQVYNTIQIFSQCWLKENLNVGIMIPGNQEMIDNGIIEKHCYNDDEAQCTIYGGYYQWDEMLNYTNKKNSQGICPQGWHIPTDEDWKILEGAADSLYGIGNSEWEIMYYRGYDAGMHLKSNNDCWSDYFLDTYGFSALAAGYHYDNNFQWFCELAVWWTQDEYNISNAIYRGIAENTPQIDRRFSYKSISASIRCLRDY